MAQSRKKGEFVYVRDRGREREKGREKDIYIYTEKGRESERVRE